MGLYDFISYAYDNSSYIVANNTNQHVLAPVSLTSYYLSNSLMNGLFLSGRSSNGLLTDVEFYL